METETLYAATTRSLYFVSTVKGEHGKRLEAGTMVSVTENRRGELVARARLAAWNWGRAVVSPADLDGNI